MEDEVELFRLKGFLWPLTLWLSDEVAAVELELRLRGACGIDDADPSDKPLEESKEGDLWEDRDKAGHESAPIRGGEELVQGLFQTGFLSLSQGGGKKGSFKEMEASLIAPEE